MDWKKHIRKLEKLGFTLTEMHKRTGASISHIADLKTGRTPEPKHALGEQLIKLLESKP
jgi:predicted transcriptional regulator